MLLKWEAIYCLVEISVKVWNEDIKTTLTEEMEEERSKMLWHRENNENREAVNNVIPMKEIRMNQEDLKREIKK